jgi:hypothetical protein
MNKAWRTIGLMVIVLCVVGTSAAGVWSVRDGLAPRALSVVDSGLHTELGDQVASVQDWIGKADTEVARVTGVDAKPVTSGSDAYQAYENAWVNPKAGEVEGLTIRLDQCRDLVAEAEPMLSGETLFTLGVYQAWVDALPKADAKTVADELEKCGTFIDTRLPALDKLLGSAKERAGMAVAGPLNDQARAELKTAMDNAAKILSGSKDKVADNAVRTTLETLGKQAADTLAAAVPTQYTQVETDTAAVKKLADELVAATKTVSDAQTAWQQTEDDKAREQAEAEAQAGGWVYTPPANNGGGGGTTSGGGTSTGGGTSSGGGGGAVSPPTNPCAGAVPPNVQGHNSGGKVAWGVGGGYLPSGCGTGVVTNITMYYNGQAWDSYAQWSTFPVYVPGATLSACFTGTSICGYVTF